MPGLRRFFGLGLGGFGTGGASGGRGQKKSGQKKEWERGRWVRRARLARKFHTPRDVVSKVRRRQPPGVARCFSPRLGFSLRAKRGLKHRATFRMIACEITGLALLCHVPRKKALQKSVTQWVTLPMRIQAPTDFRLNTVILTGLRPSPTRCR